MVTNDTNRRIRLANRPSGVPTENEFEVIESDVPTAADGEVVIRTRYLSVDPYLRGRMREGATYHEAWDLGDVLESHVVGEVVESSHPAFERGDIATGRLEWGDYGVADGDDLDPVDPELAPISTALGALGMPGRTAYFGTLEIAKPAPGETMVVSGAAGAVGSVAGQIGLMADCRVVGIAGSDEKTSFLTDELGFDAGVNYRATTDLRADLEAACPNGVDVYFDNVGGEVTDAVVPLITNRARIVLCGQIALYNEEETPTGPRHFLKLSRTHATVTGFSVRQYRHRRDEATERLAAWADAGTLRHPETITDGLENAPAAFIGLFEGENVGKQLVRVGEPETDRAGDR